MRHRSERVGHCGYAVRKSDRSERRFRGGPAVQLPTEAAGKRRVITRRELHEQIVRMLPIVNLLSVAEFAGREQIRIAAFTNRPRLETDHAAEGQLPSPRVSFGHPHQPVDASRLMGATVT